MRTVLRLRDAMDVIYADEKDLSGIGMSRPEQKRLKAAYQKLFPKATIMGKLKKKILRKGNFQTDLFSTNLFSHPFV
ncbi:unnamed protein product [Anisakis simplex]|uniref:non-specific protein-tyrosine kinase n=1 Tax=Anisakis simplex TaxID=6269 RepID=A0A0M3KJF8_ANISI|nr:unnamed protein product [Anisakis simplex]